MVLTRVLSSTIVGFFNPMPAWYLGTRLLLAEKRDSSPPLAQECFLRKDG